MKHLVIFFILFPILGFCGQNFSVNQDIRELYQGEKSSIELVTLGKLESHNEKKVVEPIVLAALIYLGVSIIVRNICLTRIFYDWRIKEWKGLIPYYNNWIIANDILELEPWVIMLGMVDATVLIFGLIMNIKLAKAYGRSALFGIGLLFLPIIFYPILAYS